MAFDGVYTARFLGLVEENQLEDYMLQCMVNSTSESPSFYLVLPADRYSTQYCVTCVSGGTFNPDAVEGLARRISNAPFMADTESRVTTTLTDLREGLQFFEGHHIVMPNVYMVDYGS